MERARTDLDVVDRPGDRVVVVDDARSSLVELGGEQDAATAGAVAATLRCAAQAGRDVVVDLRTITFMDASTIGVLVAARDDLRSHGRTLSLRSPSRVARRLVSLCGLDDMLEAAEPGASARWSLASWVAVPPAAVGRAGAASRAGS